MTSLSADSYFRASLKNLFASSSKELDPSLSICACFPSHLAAMPRKGEIFWEVGKSLTKETWAKGECLTSPAFPITDTCSLMVKFYPGGVDDTDRPIFRYIRTNTEGTMKMCGTSQLCHGTTIAKMYTFEDDFKVGESVCKTCLDDIGSLKRLKIFHSLPELCYRLLYTIVDT
ncbi:unnamed protein product [Larinioides sclopetarius]|uniref:Uncharacterized protein n=1 Tax=Larinioides sclopetarius TaxID=280406 RepID=A0AAV1YSD4_9ARAC